MKTIRLSFACLFALPLLGGCSPGTSQSASQSTSQSTSAQAPAATVPGTALGRIVDTATRHAREELRTRNLDISDGVNIEVGDRGRKYRVGGNDRSNLPKAEITPGGDLLIEGKAVELAPAQRALLLDYRREILTVADAGMALGVKGADLAGEAVLQVMSGVIHGNADTAGKQVEAKGRKLKAEAQLICAQLGPMLATQQQLAASLPAFKPYARMTQDDVDNCMKNDDTVVTRQ